MTRVTVVMRGSDALNEDATLQPAAAKAEVAALARAAAELPGPLTIRGRSPFLSAASIYLIVATALSLSLHAFGLACLLLVMVDDAGDDSQAISLWAEPASASAQLPPRPLELEPVLSLEPVETQSLVVDVAQGVVAPEPVEISAPALADFQAADGGSEVAESSTSPVEIQIPLPVLLAGGAMGTDTPLRDDSTAARGGSLQKDEVIAAGLRWLLTHQQADGSWRFDHRSICGSACRDAGYHASTTAATALGLLPLLAAGHSPTAGEHQQAVARGVAYLRSRLVETPYGGDLQEGDMYGQGLATLVLCQTLAMSRDDNLRRDCQLAVDYIVYAQNEHGGWRYFPKQPGDTTVLGWQVAALKAAERAGIEVPQRTWDLAERFLDFVQSDGGVAYGYQSPEPQPTTTAIGLLARRQMGLRASDDRWRRGVALLEGWGPSRDDIYFNYYAAQVLSRAPTSSYWQWNAEMRDLLIRRQASDGHEAGSWYFADPHTLPGGRLCDTSLALLTLEAWYQRTLPSTAVSVSSSAQRDDGEAN